MKRIVFIQALDKNKAVAKKEKSIEEILFVDNKSIKFSHVFETEQYDAVLIDDEIKPKDGEIGYDSSVETIFDAIYCDENAVKVLKISNNELFTELPVLTKKEIFKYLQL